MGKIKIYIKLVDGVLEYRDSETQHGKTITTEVNKGDNIIWTLDKCSGISEITKITINESTEFFSEGPEKLDFYEFKAEVSKKAKGQVTYDISYVTCGSSAIITGTPIKPMIKPNSEPPVIVVKP